MPGAHEHRAAADLVRALAPKGERASRFAGLQLRRAQITAVTSAGPPAVVSLQLAGSSTTVTGIYCLRGYSPSAGHNVSVLIAGPDWLVLG